MKDGFVKVASITPDVKVADTEFNASQIIARACAAAEAGAKIIVFPELSVTGFTARDLMLGNSLLECTKKSLLKIAKETKALDALIIVGAIVENNCKIYDVAVVIKEGTILGFVPRSVCFDMGGAQRFLTPYNDDYDTIIFDGKEYSFGTDLLFRANFPEHLVVGVEVGLVSELMDSPAKDLASNGATVIVNPSALACTVGAYEKFIDSVSETSRRLNCVYISALSGEGESTQDEVFAGGNVICECGEVLSVGNLFAGETVFADIDLQVVSHERRVYPGNAYRDGLYSTEEISFKKTQTSVDRKYSMFPFIADDEAQKAQNAEDILNIQAYGLKKRLMHIGCKNPVLGISGGLDSTLALLVCAKAMDLCSLPRKNIIAVTMPCFGTSGRTYKNACTLTKALGATLKEISIKESVLMHFSDIGQDPEKHDVTFENAQARERTQVLMDVANSINGIVIGTGDLSELALGFATYNGDHMSMYAVNADIPKTLMRSVLRWYAKDADEKIKKVILDVIDTPVSPELLPLKDGEVSQKTEDIVGPYELHDFFLYYFLRYGFSEEKILRIALLAFKDKFDEITIKKWLDTFTRRFYSSQFKRSCLPDGPKVVSVNLSPRGGFMMSSDSNRIR